ncbi:MAG: outer membrane beta-barrel protein [Fimbriimonadaceae bacterium]|nr:outer membrane beta-barrel protein [Fimbriimonadaceae bacterium]
MKRTLWMAALGLAAVAPAAQTSSFGYPSNLSFRLGWVYPIDSVTRNNSRSLIGVGVDYFLERSLLENGETVISFDWLGKSGSGAKGNIFPIMLNQRFYNNDGTNYGTERTYWFFGAGVSFIDVVNSDTVLTLGAGVGKEFGQNIFGEVRFLYSDSAGGARATSVGAYVGYRF